LKRVKEAPKQYIGKLIGIVLLALATMWGSLWVLRSEIRPHTGQESAERFARFSQEVDAILASYGIDTKEHATVTGADRGDEHTSLQGCILLEGGYQLYYQLDGGREDERDNEWVWCKLISPLQDSAVDTEIDLNDERLAPFFEVARCLSNTCSEKRLKSRAATQQKRLFRYVKEEPDEVERSYIGNAAETILVKDPDYEHEGFSCRHYRDSRSYCLGVRVAVESHVYRYKEQYYSTVEIISELNRA